MSTKIGKNNRFGLLFETNQTRKKSKKSKIKKMQCSPLVEGETILSGSCFTKDALKKMVHSYNKHKKDKIKYTTDKDTWLEIRNRLPECNREDCWLGVIKDRDERRKLDSYLFAPDHPEEWKKDPNTWLSNYDILDVLHQYERKYRMFHFIGPSPIDFDTKRIYSGCVWEELCKFDINTYLSKRTKQTRIAVVFNLSKSTELGTHWVALYIDLHDKFIYYFDSAGNSMPDEVDVLIRRIQNQVLLHPDFGGQQLTEYNNTDIDHQQGNTECGMYCLFFIITMLTSKTDKVAFADYKEKIEYFKNPEKKITDNYISKFRKRYFNTK
jgi:hypothetical protein